MGSGQSLQVVQHLSIPLLLHLGTVVIIKTNKYILKVPPPSVFSKTGQLGLETTSAGGGSCTCPTPANLALASSPQLHGESSHQGAKVLSIQGQNVKLVKLV